MYTVQVLRGRDFSHGKFKLSLLTMMYNHNIVYLPKLFLVFICFIEYILLFKKHVHFEYGCKKGTKEIRDNKK